MNTISSAWRRYRWSPVVVSIALLAFLTSCELLEELAPVSEFGPTPVELQPKIVLQSLPTKGIEVAAWTIDDEHIITAVGSTRSIAIWEVATGHIVDRIRIPSEEGRTGALLKLSGIEVTPDGQTAIIEGLSALYVGEDEYAQPRTMRYEMDLTKRTVTIAASEAVPGIDLDYERIETASDALEALFENDDEEFDTLKEALAELPSLPRSHDGAWALERLPLPSEGDLDDYPKGGLLLSSTTGDVERELIHTPMQKFDAAKLSPGGRWIAMTNDKMEEDVETGRDQSIIEIYNIQTAAFEPQVRIIGDYSQIQWLSDDLFAVTETSVSYYGGDEDEDNSGAPPDAVIVNANGGEIEERIEARCYMKAVADGSFIGAGTQVCRAFPQGTFGLEKYDARAGVWRKFGEPRLAESTGIDLIAVSPDGTRIAISEIPTSDDDQFKIMAHIVDAQSGELLFSRAIDELEVKDKMAFSPDGKDLFVSGNGQIFRWETETNAWGPMAISSLDTTLMGRKNDVLAVAGEADDAIGLFDFDKGEQLPSLQFGNVSSGGFFPDKPLFWAFSAEEGLRLWDTRDWSVVMTTYFFENQGFLAVTPEGRYDSNIHPYDAKFRWLVPDQPFVSLNPDAFSRDYYTPGLTERWITCSAAQNCESAFAPIKPLASLNRELPEVEIVSVEPGERASEAIVTVEISQPIGSAMGNEGSPWAFDPRMFRNHQLVYRQPGSETENQSSLSEWRSSNAVTAGTGKDNGSVRLTSVVSLGTSDEDFDQEPIFTAYVFNEDRIKSETAYFDYERPEVEARTPKAFVIALGIDHYQETRLNLNFAGNDADLMAQSLSAIPGYDMRTLSVRTAGAENAAQTTEPAPTLAANQPGYISPAVIGDLLAILSQPEAPDARARLSDLGIDASMLEQATPDDLVIISYAGHGWTDSSEEFYLVTSNAAWSEGSDTPDKDGLISSVQLAGWMSEIDAGTMALVIDACHSAASVENGTFKPGPLGDPGLGQLAFDKGALILTATQADDVAVEDASLKHGLLTYVLASESFGSGSIAADYDENGQIDLIEWLEYAVYRLPEMQTDPRVEGLATRTLIFHDRPEGSVEKRIQEPSLFDFGGLDRSIVLRQVPR